MINNVKVLMQKLNFLTEDQNELLKVLNNLLKNEIFLDIIYRYNNDDFEFSQIIEDAKKISQNDGLCEYTVYMLLFLCMAQKLHERYIQKNISDIVFYNTLCDLKYKLEECKLVHKKIGTFVPAWYKGFFEMKIFALGRLQFEINHTWFDCTVNGTNIPKGTKVLSVHIPRTGMPLNHDAVVDSYNRAKEFFKNEFNDKIIFICSSWLLYPWNRTVYKEGSNLALFYDDFTIVSSGEYQNYSECWRLFDCLYDGNVERLPNDTSLRRSYIERMKKGEPIGHGTGIIL